MIATCPPDETLRRYLLGDFSDGEGSELESHLAECAACEETLSRFDDTHDSLLRHLPLAAGSSVDFPTQVSPWLERLMQGPPPPRDDDPPAEEPTAGLVIEGLENYELTGVLGKGGMGVVYRAVHRQLNRPVAIKVIRPKLFSAAEARQRFAREIQILGGLNHPGIVAATDAGKIGPAAYLVMELIDGVDFSRLVRRGGPLAIGEAAEVARQIAAALAAVHNAGAIHRDVKPSNVMLDRAGRVKLLDFGLAHLAQPERDHPETSMGRLLGTLDFMAPEQADGDSVGPAADLYAIGATLFFLLTGRPPRSGEGEQTLLQQLKSLVQNEIPPLTELRADVPAELSDLVAQLLAKDPADRPATAQEIAQRLATWADREAVERLCEALPSTPEPDPQESISQSISQSLTELLGSQLASQVEPHIASEPPQLEQQPGSRGRRVGGILIALALMGAILWAGITLLIKTPSGTIRIESDVAGIQVELLDEQEQTKTLEIKQGENRSELKAGRYRILIAGGHDHLAVTPQEITLQKGEEKIARITQVNAEGEVAKADDKGQRPFQWEPLYQGEPLSVWAQRFRDEADPLAKIEAGKALVLLARSLPPEERFARIMWVGGQLVQEGWNTPALKLESMRNPPFPEGYRRPTSWPTDAGQTVLDEFAVLRDLSASQLAAEEPLALANRLSGHLAHENLNETWFVLHVIGSPPLDRHLRGNQPAVDAILSRLIHREDKNFNRVSVLRSARFFPHASVSVQAAYAGILSVMGKRIAEGGLPSEEAWLGESWSNTAQVVGVEPQIRAEVAFRHLIDHAVAPTAFEIVQDYRSELPAAILMAEHWIHLTNRWLEEHKAQPDLERLANVIEVLDGPLRIRPSSSEWEVDRTSELLTEVLKFSYDEQSRGRRSNLESHKILSQIVLCGGDVPEFAKQPPEVDRIQEKLRAFRTFRSPSSASGILLEAPFPTMELLTSPPQTSQNQPSSINFSHKLQVAGGVDRVDPRQRTSSSWMRVDSLLIVAILADLSGQAQDRDEVIAAFLGVNLRAGGIHPPIQDLLESEFATRQIAEHHLRKIKQRTDNEKLIAAIEQLFPGLEASPETETDSKDEPAMKADTQPAEVEHTGPEALYQGEPLSVWQRRFEAETEPIAKIEAGKALVLLARSLPPEQRFARIMWVGGQLIQEGWNTPALKLRSMRDANTSAGSWLDDENQTIFKEYLVLRNLSVSQLVAEEPLALAKRLTDHVAQGEPNEAWFAIKIFFQTALEEHLHPSQPAIDWIVSRLRRPEDKDLNRVILLRFWQIHSMASKEIQDQYEQELITLGKELVTAGLPSDQAWLGASWERTARAVGISPQIRAEVAFRQLIDHGITPTVFNIALVVPDQPHIEATTQMAGHWIDLTNRWLEEHQDQPEAERLANVIDALNYPLYIRPFDSKWKVDRTAELLTELLRASYEDRPVAGQVHLEPLQLLDQIILCGAEIPEVAKSPPQTANFRDRLEAVREFTEGATPRRDVNDAFGSRQGIAPEYPYPAVKLILEGDKSISMVNIRRLIASVESITGPGGFDDQKVPVTLDPVLLLAILTDLTSTSEHADERIAEFLEASSGGRGASERGFASLLPYQKRWRNQTTPRATNEIVEGYLRKMRQRTKSEKLREAIDKLAPGLEDAPEAEVTPKDEPAMDPKDKPAPDPAEVDLSGPEPLYQGEPVSVWQRRFEAEVNPVSKIEAAKAMIALASRLPPEEQLDRMVKIGGELLREGWGDSAVRAPLGFYLRDAYPPTRWSVDTYPTVMEDFQSLISLINTQIDPDFLIRHLTEHVAKSEPHDAAFAMLPLIGISASLPPKNQRVPGRIAAQLGYSPWIPNQEAADIFAARLRREDLPALHRAALLFRLKRSHIASEEARQFVIDDMQSAGRRLTEQGIEDDPREIRFAQTWIQGAKDLQLDSQLITEVQSYVQFWMLIEKDEMPKGLDTPGSIHERFSHYENMKRNPQLDAPDLDQWIERSNRWLVEHAEDPNPERLTRVVEALTHALQMRPSGEVGDVDETAQLLKRRLTDYYQRLAQSPDIDIAAGSNDPDYLPHDLLAAIVLCGAEIPETAKNPPLSEQARDGLEVVRRMADRSMPRDEFQEIFRGRGRFAMQYTYPGIKAIVEGDSKILPLIDILISASRHVADHPQSKERISSPAIEPVLLVSILTDLTGISEDADERIAESLALPHVRSHFSEGLFARTLSFHMQRDLPLATNEIVERYLRKMRQRTKSEKLRVAIDKLAPGLEDAPEVEADPKDDPAMEAEEKPATQPAEVDHTGPEALYQGEPLSVWQGRFESETDPLSKLKAAQALVSLTQGLPANEKFDRIMSIGGELLEDGWGPEAAMEQIVTYQAIGFFGPERYNKLVAKRWPPGSAEQLKESWDRLRVGGRGSGWGLIGTQLSTIPPRELAAMLVERVAQGENLEPHFVLLIERGGYVRARILGDQAAADLVIRIRGLRPRDGEGDLAKHLQEAALLARSDYYAAASAEAQAEFLSEMAEQTKRMIEPEYLPFSKLSFEIWRLRANELKLDSRLLTEVVLAGFIGEQQIVPREFAGEIADYAGHRLKFQRAPGLDDFLFRHWGPVVAEWLEWHQEVDQLSDEARQLYRENLARVLPTLENVLSARLPSDDWKPEELGELLSGLVRDRLEGGDIVPAEISTATLLSYIVLCDLELPEIVKQPTLTADVNQRLKVLRQLVTTETTGEEYDRRVPEFAGVFQEAPYPAIRIILEGDQIPAGRGLSLLLEESARPDIRTRTRRTPNQSSWVEPSLLLAIAADLAGASEAQDDRIVEMLVPGQSRREFVLGNIGLATQLHRRFASDFSVRQTTQHHLRQMRQRAKSEKLHAMIKKIAPGLEADEEKTEEEGDEKSLSIQEAADSRDYGELPEAGEKRSTADGVK